MKKILLSLLLMSNSVNLFAFELPFLNFNNKESDFIAPKSFKPNTYNFHYPQITFINQKNESVTLNNIFTKDKNIVFAFFFTQCVSLCTTVTLSLKSIQSDLPENTVIAMISIDPDIDTPDILNNYAKIHKTNKDGWHLLTGEKEDIINFQKHFKAYRGNKMNHSTSIYVKKSHSDQIIEFKNNFVLIPEIIKTNK